LFPAQTEFLIQTTLREHLGSCTVITIAHRINTIMDSTMILVLRDGLVAEYGAPSDLLKDTDSEFAKVVEQEQRGKHQ
jgi:ATP-binding cassette subfamily C (CFTR/MRP) protein 1